MSDVEYEHLKKMQEKFDEDDEEDKYEKPRRSLRSKVKVRLEENRKEREREKEIYKEAYRKAKYGALKQKAQRVAQARFGRTPTEKVSRVVLGKDYKKRKPSRKKSHKKQRISPATISPLGNNYKPANIDPFGSFGEKSRKKKKSSNFDPIYGNRKGGIF